MITVDSGLAGRCWVIGEGHLRVRAMRIYESRVLGVVPAIRTLDARWRGPLLHPAVVSAHRRASIGASQQSSTAVGRVARRSSIADGRVRNGAEILPSIETGAVHLSWRRDPKWEGATHGCDRLARVRFGNEGRPCRIHGPRGLGSDQNHTLHAPWARNNSLSTYAGPTAT